MNLRPLQSKPATAFATQLSFKPVAGLSPGSGAYCRVGIVGFINEDGIDVAICTPIEKNGEPAKSSGSRTDYYIPVAHLVMAPCVSMELAEEAERRKKYEPETLRPPDGGREKTD